MCVAVCAVKGTAICLRRDGVKYGEKIRGINSSFHQEVVRANICDNKHLVIVIDIWQ
jgi:hypothetical protein